MSYANDRVESTSAVAGRDLRKRADAYRRWQLWSVVVALLAIGGYCMIVWLPRAWRLAELRRQIDSESDRLVVERARASDLPGLEREVAELRDRLEDYRPLPDGPQFGPFLRDLSDRATQLSLRGLRYEPQTPTPRPAEKPICIEMPIRVVVEGDFVNVFNFLRQTEELPRLLRVREVTIEPLDDPLGNGRQNSDSEVARGEVRLRMVICLYTSAGTNR